MYTKNIKKNWMGKRCLIGMAILGLSLVTAEQAISGYDDYGGGWAVPSLDTSISISNDVISRGIFDRQILGENDSGNNTQEPASTNSANLNYLPSLQLRKGNYAKFVEITRANDPIAAADLETLFASTDVVATIGDGLQSYELRIDNLADVYTVYWITAWEAANRIKIPSSKAQSQAVQKQVVSALRTVKALQTATDAMKQELAESLLVQAVIMEVGVEQANANPELQQKISAAIKQGARTVGLDLEAVTLTETGFVANQTTNTPTNPPLLAAYDDQKGKLNLYDVEVNNQHYQAVLQQQNTHFKLLSASAASVLFTFPAHFGVPGTGEDDPTVLYVPVVRAFGQNYQVKLKHLGNFVFELQAAVVVN